MTRSDSSCAFWVMADSRAIFSAYARDYADELMERVESHMMKAVAVIRQGREELGMGQAAAAGDEPPAQRADPIEQPQPSRRPAG